MCACAGECASVHASLGVIVLYLCVYAECDMHTSDINISIELPREILIVRTEASLHGVRSELRRRKEATLAGWMLWVKLLHEEGTKFKPLHEIFLKRKDQVSTSSGYAVLLL